MEPHSLLLLLLAIIGPVTSAIFDSSELSAMSRKVYFDKYISQLIDLMEGPAPGQEFSSWQSEISRGAHQKLQSSDPLIVEQYVKDAIRRKLDAMLTYGKIVGPFSRKKVIQVGDLNIDELKQALAQMRKSATASLFQEHEIDHLRINPFHRFKLASIIELREGVPEGQDKVKWFNDMAAKTASDYRARDSKEVDQLIRPLISELASEIEYSGRIKDGYSHRDRIERGPLNELKETLKIFNRPRRQ